MMIACVNLRDAKMEPQLKASLSLDTVGDHLTVILTAKTPLLRTANFAAISMQANVLKTAYEHPV